MNRIVAVLVLVGASSAVHAQNYEVSWWTVDGGGTTSAAGGTFTLGATAGQPDAGGPFAGGTYLLGAGFWAVAGGGGVVPQANLGITKTDGVSVVNPGAIVRYTIVASNTGPSAVTNATVADTPPSSLANVEWICAPSAGSSCPAQGTGPINAGVDLPVGGTATFTLVGGLSPVATGTLVNSATIAAPGGVLDPNAANNVAADTDTIVRVTEGELTHGMVVRGTLAAVGGVPDVDLYHVRLQPYSSYEVVLDEASGDISSTSGPILELVQADGTTFVQNSRPVGIGPARSLRFGSDSSTVRDNFVVAVYSNQCDSSCGADDAYRVRMRETTVSIPRFNTTTQTTVLMLQNVSAEPVALMVNAWGPTGTLLGQRNAFLQPREQLLLNLDGIAPAASGSLTIWHTAPYGGLAGKVVALEVATGFGFDSPLVWRAR